jgi:hypothetical protein
MRLLAARQARLIQAPGNDARSLDARDRLLRAVERTQDGLLDQLAAAIVIHRHGLDAHEPNGKLSCRHGLRRVAQLVIDEPQAFTGTEPGAACSLMPRTDLLRPDIRISSSWPPLRPARLRFERGSAGVVLPRLLLN